MMYAARAADSFIFSSKAWLQVSGLVCAARVLLPSLTVASPPRNLDNEVTHRPERGRKLARRLRLSTRESSCLACIFRTFCGVRRSGLFYRHELRLARNAPNQFPLLIVELQRCLTRYHRHVVKARRLRRERLAIAIH
jgi:hypothetical protein